MRRELKYVLGGVDQRSVATFVLSRLPGLTQDHAARRVSSVVLRLPPLRGVQPEQRRDEPTDETAAAMVRGLAGRRPTRDRTETAARTRRIEASRADRFCRPPAHDLGCHPGGDGHTPLWAGATRGARSQARDSGSNLPSALLRDDRSPNPGDGGYRPPVFRSTPSPEAQLRVRLGQGRLRGD